ncbi:MltA-interacting MipA family protein [Photobacterium aquae]|uniref:MltA-interacting MipA family protein n=1 Tax=Photobacterium aquae TaxID=1195763 RepID=A0A0J1GVP9_9GAMM|nr:MltA-interacting MipA family protein [Photobacterium aquae]
MALAESEEALHLQSKPQGMISVHDLRARRDGEQQWGIAATIRTASIPYATKDVVEDTSVSSFLPLMFYEGDRVFLRGMEGGLNLYRQDSWELNALLRMHFIDIPSSFQNQIGGDTADYGLQYRYLWGETYSAELELLSDPSGRMSTQAVFQGDYLLGDWRLKPELSAIWKDRDYNSYYYGLQQEEIGAGVDVKAGGSAAYHVTSNLYLFAGAHARYFDSQVRASDVVEDDWQGEFYLGFGFFNDQSQPRKKEIGNQPYLRIAHGWATPSNIGDIFAFNREKDPFNNQLSSVFYGYPLTDELFGLPLDIFLTPGVVWHWSSDVQPSSQEYLMAIKAYYTFDWPVKWRFGLAEGLSYANRITYIEQSEMDRKGYEPSKLLNYLDFSFDVNLGYMFNNRKLDGVWAGYSLHHRSAIFESASQFGRIKGGSNYNTVYIQFDL